MTLFENNLGIYGSSQPDEIDLTGLEPNDIRSEDTGRDYTVMRSLGPDELTPKYASFDINHTPRDSVVYMHDLNRRLVPISVTIHSSGIIGVQCNIYNIRSKSYAGGSMIYSSTANIKLPQWIRYKAQALIQSS